MRNAQVILNEVLSEGQSVDFIQLLIPAHVTGEDHLPFMEDRKYAIGGLHSLVDYSVGGADDLSKACVDRVRIGETFRRHYRPHVRIGAQWSYGFPYLDAPALSVLPGKFMRNRAQNTTQLIACGFGPIVGHDANPESISFSMESNSSSSEMNSPFSNSLREISIIRLKAARLRHVSTSSHPHAFEVRPVFMDRVGYSVSSAWGSRRKSTSPMCAMPLSSYVLVWKGAFVITTFLKKSPVWRSENVSCSRFSAVGWNRRIECLFASVRD